MMGHVHSGRISPPPRACGKSLSGSAVGRSKRTSAERSRSCFMSHVSEMVTCGAPTYVTRRTKSQITLGHVSTVLVPPLVKPTVARETRTCLAKNWCPKGRMDTSGLRRPSSPTHPAPPPFNTTKMLHAGSRCRRDERALFVLS